MPSSRLRQLGDHRVVGVHHVADRREAGLADQLVGVQLLEAEQLARSSRRGRAGSSGRRPRAAARSPVVIRKSSLSMRGEAGAPPLTRSTTTTVLMAASTAVPQTSPSPWRACPSPIESIPPGTLTGKYAVTPARISGVSMLPPCAAGVMLIRTSPAAGRDPDGAVHRVQRQVDARGPTGGPGSGRCRPRRRCRRSTPAPRAAGAASPSRGSSVSAPKCGNVLEAAQSRAGTISTKCTASVSPTSAPSTAIGPGDRVEERERADLAGQVVDAADVAGEAVLGGQLDDRAGRTVSSGLAAAEGVGVLLGRGRAGCGPRSSAASARRCRRGTVVGSSRDSSGRRPVSQQETRTTTPSAEPDEAELLRRDAGR